MRHLAAMLNVREVGKDQFVHTKFSRELANYPMKDAAAYVYVHVNPVTTLLSTTCALIIPQIRRLLAHLG
jgi:hypothetical protein